MQAIVLAGGKGTRLGSNLPKPLVPVAGVPALLGTLSWLAQHGTERVVVCTGFGAEDIERSIASWGALGLDIAISVEPEPLGTAGATRFALDLLEDRFVVAYADVVADLDLSDVWRAHASRDVSATLVAHPNDHPFDSDRLVTDHVGMIERLVKKEDQLGPEAGALCSAALYVVEKSLVASVPEGTPLDFARDLFPEALRRGERLYAYRTTEFIKDMGTPKRLAAVELAITSGRSRLRKKNVASPALIVDRDGVLVEDGPFIRNPDEITILPAAARALKLANAHGVPAVCCTNQPVVARGDVDEAGLARIHAQMEGLFGREGAWIDAIFVCPHHPDRGFEGERTELKGVCDCRKPAPGLLLEAQSAMGIDLAASIYVGDRTTDMLAAERAGAVGVGVMTGTALRDGRAALEPEVTIARDIEDAARLLICGPKIVEPILEHARRQGVIAIGGRQGAGKSWIATAIALALARAGVPTVRLSLDRFILPERACSNGRPFEERIGVARAREVLRGLAKDRHALVPGYDALKRRRSPGRVLRWPNGAVLIVDGLLAMAEPAGYRIFVRPSDSEHEARRAAVADWRFGSDSGERADWVRARGEEDRLVDETAKLADTELSA